MLEKFNVETFSRTWKDHVKEYDNGYEQRTEIEGSSNKTIPKRGDKVYETFAVGKVIHIEKKNWYKT